MWGDSISYTYLQQQQQVGAGGKPYTKACYLHSVTDAFGRKAVFNYENKLWSDATASSPREYADPHKALPSDTPNGFRIAMRRNTSIRSPRSTAMEASCSRYASSILAARRAVVNVAGDSGDTCKRLLTGVQLANARGASLPGFRFDYHLDTALKTNLGALRSITFPTAAWPPTVMRPSRCL